MKAFYIPSLLLAAILGFSLWAGQYVGQRSEAWNQILEQADSAARTADWELAHRHLQDAYASWDKRQPFFHTIMDHKELDEAKSLFAGAFAACQERDNEDFHILVAQLSVQLELLAETQAINIKNVL